MEFESQLRVTKLVIDIGNYFGFVPFEWDTSAKKIVDSHSSNWVRYKWPIVITLTCLTKLVIILHLMLGIHPMDYTRFGDLAHACVVIVLFMTLGFDLHFVWKRNEMKAFMNDFNENTVRFISKDSLSIIYS